MSGPNDPSMDGDGTETSSFRSDEGVGSDVLTTVFDLLRASRRRYLLYFLYSMDGTVASFDDTTRAVQAYESASKTMLGSPSYRSIRTDLLHMQFPRLVEAGVVEADHGNETVRVNDCAPLEEWLTRAHRIEFG